MRKTLQNLVVTSILVWAVTVNAQDANQSSTNDAAAASSTKPWLHPSMNSSNDLNPSESTVNTNMPAAADNTAVNARDRSHRTLTPLDQGNSQPDLNTTAQIRKQIIADKSLSVNAQNVKIITANGQVVLRGPVNNAGEKRQICDIAKNVAGTQNVDDQLEVAANGRSN